MSAVPIAVAVLTIAAASAVLVRHKASLMALCALSGAAIFAAGLIVPAWLAAVGMDRVWLALPWTDLTGEAPAIGAGLLIAGYSLVALCPILAFRPSQAGRLAAAVRTGQHENPLSNVWHLGIVAVAFLALQVLLAVVAGHYLPVDPVTNAMMGNIVAIGIITPFLLRHESRSLQQIVSDEHQVPAGLWWGSLMVTAGLQLGFGLFRDLYLRPLLPSGPAAGRTADGSGIGPLMLAVLVVAPFFEELFFRGVVIMRLRKGGTSVFRSVVASALLFAFCHANLVQFFHTFALGCFLGWLFTRTRSLWLCVANHFVFNMLGIIPVTPAGIHAPGRLSQQAVVLMVWAVCALALMQLGRTRIAAALRTPSETPVGSQCR